MPKSVFHAFLVKVNAHLLSTFICAIVKYPVLFLIFYELFIFYWSVGTVYIKTINTLSYTSENISPSFSTCL